jgi:DNA excision repair protein ERCC-2
MFFNTIVREERLLQISESDANNSQIPFFKVSVRNLVAFTLKDDEVWSFSSYVLAMEGSRAHSMIQNRNKESANFRSEVCLSHIFETDKCKLEVSGRADGIWEYDDKVIVQEIKTTTHPLSEINENFSEVHWAQAKCYAYILALSKRYKKVFVKLTYYNKADNREKSFERAFSLDRLQKFFRTLLHPYINWLLSIEKWKETRNLTIRNLKFPFPSFRKGQKLLVYNTYKCIEDKKRLFVQAPTGIGKTMGVLFPAIKALGEGKLDRLFYATAKTTTQGIAQNALEILESQGMRLKVLTLTAKDKLCLNTVKNCHPEKCRFILGYKQHSKRIVKRLINKHDFFSREIISQAGQKYGICPFELSLDLALSCDIIICDYNYIFDPRVNLRRFFQQKGREEYLIMVDEAHNLFDRARNMYSAEICVKELSGLLKHTKKDLPEISKTVRSLKKALSSLEKEMPKPSTAGGIEYNVSWSPPSALLKPLENFIIKVQDYLLEEHEEKNYDDELATLFFDLLHFKNILELFSPIYRTLMTGKKSDFKVSLLCMDPSGMLNRYMSMARSAVLFSATLSPLWYFKDILGGRTKDVTLSLSSPFPRENLLVYNHDKIETRYSLRNLYFETTAQSIYRWIMAHKGKGNFMVFFPSYQYLTDVLEYFSRYNEKYEIICQSPDMDETSRDAFLSKFETYGDVTRIAFCVMGGVFAEGIDLVGERLTGVIIVGVGLPKVSPELELMRAYYQEKSRSGFAFAYMYPGLNKVLQAAGRLIRTEKDKGSLLLIDSRFALPDYRKLLPLEWQPIFRASQGFQIEKAVEEFWKNDIQNIPKNL